MDNTKYLRSFGRIKSHKLSENQQDLIQNFLPQIRPNIEKIKNESIWFEIGFGAGEHLIQLIESRKNNEIIIGCEPYINGAVKAIKYIHDNNIDNCFIHDSDARILIETLPNKSVEKFFILFPDPWPKKRHHKRRVINSNMIELLYSKLTENGLITIATDHEDYAEWIHKIAKDYNYLFKKFTTKSECQTHGILTRYCSKALSKNFTINLFLLER